MIAEVGLAGIRLPWRFGRTDALASWLEVRPWTVRGGVLSLGVSGPVGSDAIGDVVVNSIRQLEGSRFGRDVLVQPCNLDESPFDAHAQLRAWLELEPVPSSDEGWRATAHALADSERVWLAKFRGQHVTESAAALVRAIETINKRDARAHATVIVLCEDAATDAQLDMRRGVPLDNLGWMGAPLAHWDRYLHHRLAWEAAGDLDRAMRWQDAIGSVRAGDDASLEARLTSLAKAEWDALPGAVRDQVVQRLRVPLPVSAVQAWTRVPELEPLAWAPTSVWSPVPWLARAVLSSSRSLPSRGALRASLTCTPLREAVVARCLSWEAEFRGAAVPCGPAPARANSALSAFLAGRGRDRGQYPAESPAAPTLGWEFATLGEFLAALPPTTMRATMHDVRELRNALLHGHYVSWATLQAVDSCAAALRGGHAA